MHAGERDPVAVYFVISPGPLRTLVGSHWDLLLLPAVDAADKKEYSYQISLKGPPARHFLSLPIRTVVERPSWWLGPYLFPSLLPAQKLLLKGGWFQATLCPIPAPVPML